MQSWMETTQVTANAHLSRQTSKEKPRLPSGSEEDNPLILTCGWAAPEAELSAHHTTLLLFLEIVNTARDLLLPQWTQKYHYS